MLYADEAWRAWGEVFESIRRRRVIVFGPHHPLHNPSQLLTMTEDSEQHTHAPAHVSPSPGGYDASDEDEAQPTDGLPGSHPLHCANNQGTEL